MMKKLVLKTAIFLSLSILPCSAIAATAQTPPAFFLSLEDIPLMPGLEELPENTVAFDKPEGRIIESYAIMRTVTKEQVSAYYKQSLPQFGWGATAPNRFFRGEEHLDISFESQRKLQLVKIKIRPSL